MQNSSLEQVINKLKFSSRVKGIFLTGTTGSDLKPYSDYDLVVILDKNTEDIKSLYTNIDGRFSDIFFFDVAYLENLEKNNNYSSTSFQAMLLSWLLKGKIEYDPEEILEILKNKSQKLLSTLNIFEDQKRNDWVQANYNFIANNRYFNSGDELYHKALNLRLLYSVIGLVTAYFSFRNMPWKGEKNAIKYFEENEINYINTFNLYNGSVNLDDKMKYYAQLFKLTLTSDYPEWENDFVIPGTNTKPYDQNLVNFWNNLLK